MEAFWVARGHCFAHGSVGRSWREVTSEQRPGGSESPEIQHRGTAVQRPQENTCWCVLEPAGHSVGDGGRGLRGAGLAGHCPPLAVLWAHQEPPHGSEEDLTWTSLPKAPWLLCSSRVIGAQQEGRRDCQAMWGLGPECGVEAPSMWSQEMSDRGVRGGEGTGHRAGEGGGLGGDAGCRSDPQKPPLKTDELFKTLTAPCVFFTRAALPAHPDDQKRGRCRAGAAGDAGAGTGRQGER